MSKLLKKMKKERAQTLKEFIKLPKSDQEKIKRTSERFRKKCQSQVKPE